ncbi:MAG: hypothetical protein K6G47_02295 [Clostridia bacterium]|nr:hypothetical protein [Clostridia bacterium]
MIRDEIKKLTYVINSVIVLGFVTFYSRILDKWIVAADEKLYFGKNNGKNRVVT